MKAEPIIERLAEGIQSLLLTVVDPYSYFYWPYLLSSALIGVAVVCWRRRGREAAKGFWQVLRHPSARHDVVMFGVNSLLWIVVFAPLVAGAAVVAEGLHAALTALLGPMENPISVTPWSLAAFTVCAALLVDFTLWGLHVLFHRVPLLWRFHRVHHSAEVLTPVTATRFHPVEDVCMGLALELTVSVTVGLSMYLSDNALYGWGVLSLNAIEFGFNLLGANLRHSHVWFAYPRWLSRILVSPAQHQIHHSTDPAHRDRNMGVIFALWDWAAGTLVVAGPRQSLKLGLGEETQPHRSIWDLYFEPFRYRAQDGTGQG